MSEMDKFVEHVMEMIISRGIDKEKMKKKLISDWSGLGKRGEQLIKEMNDILREAGATDTQIEWGINLPTLSWKEEKRMCKLETELKDVLVEVAAIKGVEEALKKLEGNWLAFCFLGGSSPSTSNWAKNCQMVENLGVVHISACSF